MIKLDQRTSSTTPANLLSASCQKKIAALLLNPNKEVKDYYNSDDVRTALKTAQGEKCVYCETQNSPGYTIRVDHYRPKRYVFGIPKDQHPGYYWLAYEWTNLVLSCEICNGTKSNKFPLQKGSLRVHPTHSLDCTAAANRCIYGRPLNDEQRLLLHPELDDVEAALEFLPNGTVESTSAVADLQDRATVSIATYGLNRESLVRARQQKIQAYWFKLLRILNTFEDYGGNDAALPFLHHDLKEFFTELLAEQEPERSYSRLGFFMFDKFDEFYLKRLRRFYPDADLVEREYKDILRR